MLSCVANIRLIYLGVQINCHLCFVLFLKMISIISKKLDSLFMIKMTPFYDDFHAQNVPQVWEDGSKLRYDDRLTP